MNAVLQALCTQAKSLTTHSNSPSNTLHPSPVKHIIFQSFGELHSKARFSAHSLTVLFRTMSPWRNVLCLNSYLRLTLGFCIPALLFKSVTDYVCNVKFLQSHQIIDFLELNHTTTQTVSMFLTGMWCLFTTIKYRTSQCNVKKMITIYQSFGELASKKSMVLQRFFTQNSSIQSIRPEEMFNAKMVVCVRFLGFISTILFFNL